MRLKSGAIFAVLIAIAMTLGLAAGSASSESTALSIENAGPSGAMVLATWLAENGATVRANTEAFSEIDSQVRTVVLTAPRVQAIAQTEVDALDRFVRRGGTLVYLAPRMGNVAAMSAWLGVRRGEVPEVDDDGTLGDPAGLSASVVTTGHPVLEGVRALRVAADRLIVVDEAEAVTAPGVLWRKTVGAGEVWVSAGPDLAENARLDLLGNSRFWRNLAARGPMQFDEFHHHSAAATPLTMNLAATGLQFLACALLFVWARGVRLGPARPALQHSHRSSLEYVQAMASLMASSHLDGEIVTALREDLRRRVHEALGLPTTLPEPQWVLEVARATALSPAELTPVFSSDDVLVVGRLAARVDLALVRAK